MRAKYRLKDNAEWSGEVSLVIQYSNGYREVFSIPVEIWERIKKGDKQGEVKIQHTLDGSDTIYVRTDIKK